MTGRDVNTALDRLEATVTEYQDVISLPDVDRAREYAATVRNELQQRMTKESGRALIEDAQRWRRAYEKARDDLAAAEARVREVEQDLDDLQMELARSEGERTSNAERVRALQDGLRRRIESDDSMETGFCDCVWCVEDRALLADEETT